LLSASSDGTVRIWDVASARTLLVLDTRSGGLRSARMTSDERELITTGNDGRVITWLALEPQSWD
jgi:WD40 repeat protein